MLTAKYCKLWTQLERDLEPFTKIIFNLYRKLVANHKLKKEGEKKKKEEEENNQWTKLKQPECEGLGRVNPNSSA